jgi:hypothetical protein
LKVCQGGSVERVFDVMIWVCYQNGLFWRLRVRRVGWTACPW